eukprot:15362878-Ditylum_brightwellii.AAC.1
MVWLQAFAWNLHGVPKSSKKALFPLQSGQIPNKPPIKNAAARLRDINGMLARFPMPDIQWPR